MIKVQWRTCLNFIGEEWPSELPSVPNVNDRDVSGTTWPNGFRLWLKVVCITWQKSDSLWLPVIELGDAWGEYRTIETFQSWYKRSKEA